jgi:hypothetical protein
MRGEAMFRIFLLIVTFGTLACRGAEPIPFEKITLTDKYYCDGINFGDLNRDGKPDIVAGPFWYEGPAFKSKHEIFTPEVFETAPCPSNSLFSFIYDFNGDGWPDVLVLGRVHIHEAFWYENPKGKDEPWAKHFVTHRVLGESPTFLDVDGDGNRNLWDFLTNNSVSSVPIGKSPPSPGNLRRSRQRPNTTNFTTAWAWAM